MMRKQTSPPPTPPAVLGIGGVFFRCANPKRIRQWYAKHFGLTIVYDKCAQFDWGAGTRSRRIRQTVWAPFERNTTYFGPGKHEFMINFLVQNLDGLLAKLRRRGVKVSPEPIDESFGRFAWVFDPDGRKIELWEPPPAPRGKNRK